MPDYKNETLPVAVQYHKIPAAMRRVKKHLEKQGVPDDGSSLKQTIQLFQKWSKSGKVSLVTEEASEENLKAYIKRKRLAKKNPNVSGPYTRNIVHGKNKDEAGGDTGFSYRQYHLANEHHDADGKFAPRGEERERLLRIFQEQNRLPVTGKMDDKTKTLLSERNGTVEPVIAVESDKLSEDVRAFFRKSVG